MTATETILASRPLLLLRDGGSLREGIARRHGRRWNWARTTPRTTPTNTAHKHPQAWCEKVGRSIKGSDTPQRVRLRRPACRSERIPTQRRARAPARRRHTHRRRGRRTARTTITRRLIEEFAASRAPAPGLDQLTPRELEVFKLLATGKTNGEIAAELIVGETTVKTHVTRILMKLGVRDRYKQSSSHTRPDSSARVTGQQIGADVGHTAVGADSTCQGTDQRAVPSPWRCDTQRPLRRL